MAKMKELYEKVAADKDLQEKFSSIVKAAESAGQEATEKKLVAFAREAGYEVSIEEARKFFKILSEEKGGALSDSELDMVAGGKNLDFILTSIGSLGLECAVNSIEGAIRKMKCENI